MRSPDAVGARRHRRSTTVLLPLLVLTIMGTARGEQPAAFFAPAGVAPAALPVEGIYPRGRRLAYMGYSGDPARDLARGFTVAGPVYGNQQPYLDRCFANGWPVVAHVGLRITFHDKAADKYRVNEAVLRDTVTAQVGRLAPHDEIVWWAITPEELRPWRGDEMRYLRIVSAAIRETDPQARPIYLYNPNHRDAGSLAPIVPEVDIVAKGCYVNLTGRTRDRGWVRWTVEQEVEAIRRGGRPGAIPILMPELCRDPDPADDGTIAAWVRHDVYLGLVTGAKGVLIWSLFKRSEVRRTWQRWYDAYAACGRELNGVPGGPPGLAEVFLFGDPRSDVVITPLDGAREVDVPLGGDAEALTTTAAERAPRANRQASWTAAEFAHGSSRYVFLVNSATAPARFRLAGWPAGSAACDAFTGGPLPLSSANDLEFDLPAFGVLAVRLSAKSISAAGTAISAESGKEAL